MTCFSYAAASSSVNVVLLASSLGCSRGVMVALLQMPCKSVCPPAIAAAANVSRTHTRIINLLLRFSSARPGQNIGQRVVALVTRIFIHPVRCLVQWDPCGPGSSERRGIVDGEFILNQVRRDPREALRQMQIRVRSAKT